MHYVDVTPPSSLKELHYNTLQIDRIMEKFAERYTTQNPGIFPTADAAFILAFSVIMLNTDLHNPAIKEERRMTKAGFTRNNSGICDGQDLPEEFLTGIFDRIKENPISLKEDDEAREKVGESKSGDVKAGASGLFANNYEEMDKKRETDFQKERDEILRNTESLLRRKKRSKSGSFRGSKHFVSTQDSGMKDEYVIPMFDVAWGPALAVFSTVIESANGTMGALLSIATDHEIESAAENAASATEICLEGFTLAIRIAALCGNDTARSAYVHALSNFSLLGTGRLLEHRHVRCVQMLLELSRDDGELLGPSWEYIFKALSEIARLNQVYEDGAKFVRDQAAASERRQKREEAAERKVARAANREGDDEMSEDDNDDNEEEDISDSDEYDSFDDYDSIIAHEIHDGHLDFDEEMDRMAIDEINARTMYENIPDDLPDEIFSRSSSLCAPAIKDFIFQLCRVSRMEISGYGGHVGNKANCIDLTAVHYRKQHTLIGEKGGFEDKHNQPDIYCLQKLIEVTHYNMDTRPRLVFSDMWNIVSAHLTSTALHSNAAVAIYAVDSFRQLSMQFLKREELGVFEFQRKFIKPFEGVMLKCKNASVKEFLLKSVEQIIVMYGSDEMASGQDISKTNTGLLKSGWRPLLAVIGQASCDNDDAIANLGFSMLTSQLSQSLKVNKLSEHDADNQSISTFAENSPMRADKFVDLVEALLMYVSGPREDMSAESIDHLVTLCKYLADDTISLPQNSKKQHSKSTPLTESSSSPNVNEELELWWPILLGLSKSVGDIRPNIRIKGLITLLAIINQHFFAATGKSNDQSDLQTLQLIFRGILTPCLEHADSSASSNGNKLSLPDGFIRFMTRGTLATEVGKGGRKDRIEGQDASTGNNWIDTTFDHLMDGAVAIALRSIEVYANDALVEEMLAMFNTCLISDSSSLAVRGLKRLYHFVANDLVLDKVTDNTWATVSHMLRRCLTVGGLPFNPDSNGDITLNSEMISDFLQEENLLPQRRYIGSNATSIIGSLLTNEEIANTMGPKWYLFLYSGLGTGVCTWDKAAEIVDMHPLQTNVSKLDVQP
jgi:brefeldin A-inhibited guanine nucleotide-exchange protein